MLTAAELRDYLTGLGCHHDLTKIVVNYRYDYDSDVEPVRIVHDDLYDDDTNSTPTSIMLVSDPREV